ncbi:aminotransferase class I/II-fold pyridoxal phosphate-dependent enzyme [Francisella noatunensis]|uniref:aminotransferase class I/II-fold pyridoxal phosphate-dependent enzyme n=1 Tax=Francisella noatunensis TaxID=657445 RepID=UPI0019056559|nr:aminotransferase class I/II-fold pyridoxal phosphate-dependent enzyme [Francisella noatunensis]MBK2048910.1 aminotransferase class I/II-fold pyridoxal phosphate-dependent enzyme [Francisella noatunensis]MBK2054380.1 aminotransferase class I/II-fold pyridoxal phosphate-dependent enzyme [Francisella noatunensis]MBK2059516.1 aminotransferase class I/II-fold pyridoxal phosphate-dependent enzyme [Francisella noatunensis]MBK2060399.1 aminotransferase class I/II-fold pyridoxal phosphate-dependent e
MAKKLFGNLSQVKSRVLQTQTTLEDLSEQKADYDFRAHPLYQELQYMRETVKKIGIADPLYRNYQGVAGAKINYAARELINYSSYNYLGLNGDPRTIQAVTEVLAEEGTTVSASRIVAGQRVIHQKLEDKLAELYQTEDAIVFVSGHATNVSVISCLTHDKSLILYDQLAHNSIIQGVKLSVAKAIGFRHNDINHLSQLLQLNAHKYEQIFIVVEGLYSMDGDIPNLPEIIKLKKEYGAILMVDEAHGLGVLGKTGKGIFEHYNLSPKEVDIWMGTLSKTLCSCGGYIAANNVIIDILRHYAPGLVYSVGLSPANTVAAISSLELMLAEPDRVNRLHDNSEYLLTQLKNYGLDTGNSIGRAIIPVIVGSSCNAVALSNKLFDDYNINAMPIMYPAVEERKARLRFFISSEHAKEQLDYTVECLKQNIAL